MRRSEQSSSIPLRGVFSREDAWITTGDLFRRDGDGDLWRVDGLGDVVLTADEPAFTVPIRDALGDIPAVDLALAYGVVPKGSESPVAVAAVTLREGHELQSRDIGRALASVDPHTRPGIVHVVDEIPVTTWYRPITAPRREAGVPEPGCGRLAWYLDASGETYRPFTDAAHRRLARAAA